MSSNIGARVDYNAKRKTVYYEGSDTIYEGMVLCYNQDTTTNWLGWSGSAVSDTTAEGNQNEGKHIRVEKPATANLPFVAGYVCPGSWVGTTGPVQLDVYIPNGSIVAVRGTESFTIGQKVYVAAADYEVTNVPQAGGYCGVAMETVDRSSTEGLLLIRTAEPGSEDVSTVTNNVTADSPVTVAVTDAGKVFTNEGAAGAIEYDLPTAASAKGLEFTFSVTDGTAGNNMAIDPNGTELINFGNDADVLGAGEALTLTPADANDAGLSITLVSNGTAWVVKAAFAQAVAKFVIP